MVWASISAGLARGETVVLVTATWSVREIAEQIERLHSGFTASDHQGRVLWVDASGRGYTAHSQAATALRGPGDSIQILTGLHEATRRAEERCPNGFRIGVLGLGSMIRAIDESHRAAFVRNLLGIARRHPALGIYSVDPVVAGPEGIRELLDDSDGVLLLRTEGDRTMLRIARMTPVVSRAWVECRFPVPANVEPGPTAPAVLTGPASGDGNAAETSAIPA
jgi:hypothetical protein